MRCAGLITGLARGYLGDRRGRRCADAWQLLRL